MLHQIRHKRGMNKVATSSLGSRARAEETLAANGPIATTVHLACATCYFAGGSPYDLMAKYDVLHTEVINLVWYVVKAVNGLTKIFIGLPTDHAEQKKLQIAFAQQVRLILRLVQGQLDKK